MRKQVKVHILLIKVIITLLNYTVDLRLMNQFAKTLKILSQFYFLIEENEKSLFYFNQTRECGILLANSNILIESLIGMSKCASRANLEDEGIIFLKKAL